MARFLCPVLVHRDDQLAVLEEALFASHRGEGRFVVISGEAGIGKTRLVTELSRQAERLGSAVLWGGCSEAELSLPYLPFVEAIGNHLSAADSGPLIERLGSTGAPLGQLFPQFSAGEEPERATDPAQAKLRLFESIVSLLSGMAAERPLVLAIEDVHWADDSTRELLDHLARRLAATPVLVLITYRSDELPRRHPFVPTLRAWRRSGLAEIVVLEPLSADAVVEMVAAILGTAGIDRELAALLYGRTDGNPFVLEEMVREAVNELRSGGELRARDLDRLGIPETVRDTILLRLGRIDPEYVPVLEAGAVLGRSLDYRLLTEVSDADQTIVQRALQVAVAEQLLEEETERPGHYRWRHALTQEAIYTDIVTPRRQALHARAAEALRASPGARAVELAHHLAGAGTFDEAVPAYLAAAGEAEQTLAFRDAILLLERALPHIRDETARAHVVCTIGRLHWLNGEHTPAEGFLVEGVAELDRLGYQLEAARSRIVLGRCRWEGGEPAQAREDYQRAREVLEAQGPSADLAVIEMRLSGLAGFDLDYDEALRHGERAVAIAEEADADFERVWSLSFMALAVLDTGDYERGIELMDEAYEEAVAKGYWYIASNIAWNDIWIRVHAMLGDLEARLSRFETFPSRPLQEAATMLCESYVRLAQGKLERALEAAETGRVHYEALSSGKMSCRCRIQIAAALVELGRFDEAERILPPRSTRTEAQDVVYDAPARVRLALGLGAMDDALELAGEILEDAPKFALYRETLALAAEVFIEAGELDAVKSLLDSARAHPAGAGRSYIAEIEARLALAGRDVANLAELLDGAVRTAEEAGFGLVALRRRMLLAEARAAAGKTEDAERELHAVADEADRMGALLLRSEVEATAERAGVAVPERREELAPEVEPPAETAIGERLVTSLFADVRDYSELAARESPEELANRMSSLYRFAKVVVSRHHGIVDKFAGDAVMATFNTSGTRVDHCAEALEAALALRDKAAIMGLDVGIGIAVGSAVLGRGASADNIAVRGEVTNLAARLQAQAGRGEILLSDEAHRRVERKLTEQDLHAGREELELKGFARPQVAYRLAAAHSAVGAARRA